MSGQRKSFLILESVSKNQASGLEKIFNVNPVPSIKGIRIKNSPCSNSIKFHKQTETCPLFKFFK